MNKGLEALETIKHLLKGYETSVEPLSIIENTLKRLEDHENNCQELYYKEKCEKQDEILLIIKEKKVDMFALIHMDTVEHYNNLIHCENEYCKLTQAEFDLLKEWLR